MAQLPASRSLDQLVGALAQAFARVVLQHMGEQTGVAYSPAMPTALDALPRGPGRPRRSDAEARCLVPNCHRRSIAKKLCPTHYRKARRLEMKPPFADRHLAQLARDGRAVRWEGPATKK